HRGCARQLTLSASRRLRRSGFRAARLTLSFRGGGFRTASGGRTEDLNWGWEAAFAPARDDRTFLQALSEGLDYAKCAMRFQPKSVSVMIHGLIAEGEMMADLFGSLLDQSGRGEDDVSRAKWEKVSDLMDGVRLSHGPKALTMGPLDELPGGYLGAKIAFGRIPEDEDFSEAPVADEDTHFVSFR
ncbi:type VI secretion protein ImpB, partial [Loktanella sp. DJP18]